MKFKYAASFLLCIIIALFFTGCVTTHVHKFRMTASESPEVHGANTLQKDNSSSWRFTAKVNYNDEKKVDITENTSDSPDLDKLFDNKTEFRDAKYMMGGLDFSGKVDYLYKGSGFVIGGGLGYKDGIFSHLTVGANFSHFEFGGFIGLYSQYSDIEYWGEKGKDCKDTREDCEAFGDQNYHIYTSIFAGMYAGLYFDKLFFNLSVSSYRPNPRVEGTDLDVPGIATAYLTTGYRLNRWLEISVGGIITHIGTSESHDNAGVTGGVSFYL
jgi:hypothetical protein